MELEDQERKDSMSRNLSLYVILRFFGTPKTFKHLAADTGMTPSSLQWYKPELLARGWIRKFDSVRSSGTSLAARYVLTESGKIHMAKLEEEITASRRRKRRSPVRFIGDPDWERIETLLDSGLSLAQASRRLKLRPGVVWRKFRAYAESGRRKDVLTRMKSEGRIKSSVDEMLSRSPKFSYRSIPWEEVEILLSAGRSLNEISQEYGIGYNAFRARFDRYSKSGKRKDTVAGLIASGKISEPGDPVKNRNERLRRNPPKKRSLSGLQSSSRWPDGQD